MKKAHIYLSFLTVITMLMTSCKQDLNKIIVGKWTFEKVNISNLDKAYGKFENAYHTGMTKQKFKKTLLSEFENLHFEFDEKHKAKMTKGEKSAEGEWGVTDKKIIIQVAGIYNIITKKVSDKKIEGEFQHKVRGIRIKSQVILKKEN